MSQKIRKHYSTLKTILHMRKVARSAAIKKCHRELTDCFPACAKNIMYLCDGGRFCSFLPLHTPNICIVFSVWCLLKITPYCPEERHLWRKSMHILHATSAVVRLFRWLLFIHSVHMVSTHSYHYFVALAKFPNCVQVKLRQDACPVRHAAWQLTAAQKLCLVCTVLMLKVSQWVKAIAICTRCSSSLTVSAFLRWQSTDLLFWSIAVLFAITIPVFHKFCISLSCTAFGRENLSSTFFLTFCENTSANVTLKYSTERAWFLGYLSGVFLSVAVADSTPSFLQILLIACHPLTCKLYTSTLTLRVRVRL